jgi:hypothetical protein
MHRSRLSTLLIDVPSDQAADATAFWSAALGVQANPVPGEEQFISSGRPPPVRHPAAQRP